MSTYFTDYTQIPPNTEARLFSLLWEDVAAVIGAVGAAGMMDDLSPACGWECVEQSDGTWAATAEGWAEIAAVHIAMAAEGHTGRSGPERREDYTGAWKWRRLIDCGIGVAHRIIGSEAA